MSDPQPSLSELPDPALHHDPEVRAAAYALSWAQRQYAAATTDLSRRVHLAQEALAAALRSAPPSPQVSEARDPD